MKHLISLRTILLLGILPVFILFSGLVTIHFEHHLNLPAELTHKNKIVQHYSFGLQTPPFQKHTHIYMVDQIKDHKQLEDIVILLNNASGMDTIFIHLAGYGGLVDATERVISAIYTTKAHVVTVVEAPVYSGHALIAASGHEVKMSPFTFMMFHHSSAWNIDCSKQKGMDRAQTAEVSCNNFKNMHLYNLNSIILNLKVLTTEEKTAIMSGKEVYITVDQARLRGSVE